MKTAFKEWAFICRALGTGRQVLILRKGGIGEEAGTFRPEHREFLFFPTGFHQSPGKVLAEAHRLLKEVEADQPRADQVTFSHYAVMTDTRSGSSRLRHYVHSVVSTFGRIRSSKNGSIAGRKIPSTH